MLKKLVFDSFWILDQLLQIPLVGRPGEPMLESWSTLSLLAGITSKIRLGTLMKSITYHQPSLVAKIASTLDVLSNGRLFMGLIAAWNKQESLA